MADPDTYPGVPRWVKLGGIIALVVVLLFIALHLGGHGPGAHLHRGHPESEQERR